ncbi:class A beta-lactamase [Moritella sp. Urea-trap-13]|uniref:class A beta-lactamase n=1 Tax=Moritella sp. Urea-trap-13 TaxID=2058327 RepID=UPI000C32AD6C|nr:class A beta-lactamase [Moritella sp. Urea-trap-13]PKH07817.1 class A beta-lactamase [Moritella sp. Urea-trap-13]
MKNILLCISLVFSSAMASATTLNDSLSAIELRTSGRIGAAVLDTENKQIWHYNGDARFPMMSTFKTLACAKMLSASANGELNTSTKILLKSEALIPWSPVTKPLVGSSITVAQACEATMLTSDNTAVNIVLQHVGGPEGVTAFLRDIGDNVTQLDRIEPELNEAKIGDVRDTTTPNAMVNTLNKLLFANVLSNRDKTQLKTWMQDNKVSDPLLRSVLPPGWSIADRSGAGGYGSRGITAVIWHAERQPLIISIYLTETELSMAERNQVIAEIGQQILNQYVVE